MTDMVSKKKLTDRSPRAQGGAVKNQIASATFTSVLLARREEPQHATVDIVRLNPVLLARREEPTLDCARRYAVFFRSPRAQGGAPWLVPVIGSSQCAKFLLHRVWFHSECSPSQSPPLHRQ